MHIIIIIIMYTTGQKFEIIMILKEVCLKKSYAHNGCNYLFKNI